MSLRLIQIKLPDTEYDSIFEVIKDQKFVSTWPATISGPSTSVSDRFPKMMPPLTAARVLKMVRSATLRDHKEEAEIDIDFVPLNLLTNNP